MDIDLIALLVPILAVAVFVLIEKYYNSKLAIFDMRAKSILTLEIFAILTSLVLSSVFLIPVVMLASNWQLLSISELTMPEPLHFALSFLLIDFVHYVNHRIHHKIPILWRLHRLHHSDKKITALTTWLHHPIELMSSFVVVITLFVMFDLPVIVMVTYGIVFGIHAAFTHFNMLVPEWIDKYLRVIIVTPNAHKVHHALDMRDGNANFGQLFLFWDWMFGTYQYRSNNELLQMEYGISTEQSPITDSVAQYLRNPFK